MLYKIRTVKPKESQWFEVEGDSHGEAINTFHIENDDRIKSYVYSRDRDGNRLITKFALFEAEGHEPVVSKIFVHGIWRRGAMRNSLSIEQIAAGLGWTHSVDELLEEWDTEETVEDAEKRKYGT